MAPGYSLEGKAPVLVPVITSEELFCLRWFSDSRDPEAPILCSLITVPSSGELSLTFLCRSRRPLRG